MHAGRNLIKSEFLREIRNSDLRSIPSVKVAIVGGTRDEIELKWLTELEIDFHAEVFGIEEADTFIDLNDDVSYEKKTSKFD